MVTTQDVHVTETPATPTVLWAPYDTVTQEIQEPFESRRDAQAWCDEHNAPLMWDRFILEPTDASEWAEDQVRWSQ